MGKTKGKKRYLKDNIVKILLLIIVVWIVFMLINNQVRSMLIQTVEVKKTVLEDVDTGYGLLHGQEIAVLAAGDGPAERTMNEGQRVRKGNAVFSVNGSISYASEAGLVSYQIDGLEGTDDLNSICSTNLETRYNTQQANQKEQTADCVNGAAYAKIINTFDDVYLYLTMPRTAYVSGLETEQKIWVRFIDIEYEVQGRIKEILDAADGTRYLKLKLPNVKETVFQQRIYKIELPYNRFSAIAVPKTALVEKDGEKGVYCLQKGFVFWKAVTVGQDWGESGLVVIEDGLENGDFIVTTPHRVREGENIKF